MFNLYRTRVIVLLFVCLFFVGGRANAWGMAADLGNPLGITHLVFVVYNTHRINYCISIKDGSAGGFTYLSLDIEAREALRMWLSAVSDLTGPVELHRVNCTNPSLNLAIKIGPPTETTQGLSFQNIVARGYQRYSRVELDSTTRYLIDDRATPLIDFRRLVPPGTSIQSAISQIRDKRLSDAQITEWAGLKKDYILEVYNNSFVDMLHEFGHSFGLCDTYPSSTNCDLNYSSPANISNQPHSVMRSDRFYYLTKDDVAGIRSLFKRFAPVF